MTTNENEKPAKMLDKIDEMINIISNRITTLGAAQNRIESAIESIGVQSENITSSLSTLRDADVAQESSNYIKALILQQASATLLATANQTPSIALNLL
jgi:flagellin